MLHTHPPTHILRKGVICVIYIHRRRHGKAQDHHLEHIVRVGESRPHSEQKHSHRPLLDAPRIRLNFPQKPRKIPVFHRHHSTARI